MAFKCYKVSTALKGGVSTPLRMKKTSVMLIFLLLISISAEAQNYSRVIRLQRKRMYGKDIERVQRRFLSLGFKQVGAADGWYGPLTEGAVRTAQYYLGFPRDGRITRAFWNVLFDSRQDGLLKDISIIANYPQNAFVVTSKRIGSNNDFDGFVINTLKNDVKTVHFRHINEGLIIFRFRLMFTADAIFMIQDVYYGDYKIHVYLKTADGFFELKNGVKNPADPAMEGILNRVNEGITSAGLTVPPLIPALSGTSDQAAPAQSAAQPAAQPAAAATNPAAQPAAAVSNPAAPAANETQGKP